MQSAIGQLRFQIANMRSEAKASLKGVLIWLNPGYKTLPACARIMVVYDTAMAKPDALQL